MRVIDSLSRRLWSRVDRTPAWTNTYAIGRSVIAAGTLLTMLLNGTDVLFRIGSGVTERINCDAFAAYSLYCLIPEPQLELARYLTVTVLILVILGWRPQLTGILHFYVTYSFHASAILVDGGEQVSSVLTFLLIPVTLTDRRRSHWAPVLRNENPNIYHMSLKVTAILALLAVRVQVSVIYLNAAAAKLNVPEWVDGTAMYYWLYNPYVGVPERLQPFFEPLLTSGLVAPITWSVLVLEFVLAGALFMPKSSRAVVVAIGMLFHLAIVFLMGISSFAVAMAGALILYLWPLHFHRPRASICRFEGRGSQVSTALISDVATSTDSNGADA